MPGTDASPAEGAERKNFHMDRETARQEIRRNWRSLIMEITTPAKTRVNGEQSYICPICGHGAHGDGLTKNPKSTDGNGLKCFGCGFSGDIIDLFQQHTGADYNTAFSLLANGLNIPIDPYRPTPAADFSQGNTGSRSAGDRTETARSDSNDQTGINIPPDRKTPTEGAGEATEAEQNYTAYYRECRERVKDPAAAAYLTGRGISLATAAAYWIGYDPKADPAAAPGGNGEIKHPAGRIIIPTTTAHYVGRAIDPKTPPQYRKMNPKGSSPGIFNRRALYAADIQEVFVTEGAFDALSILEAGAAAIALNSAQNAEALIKQLEQQRTEATLIICLDNDDAGKRSAEIIKKGLQRLNIGYITADICGSCKDPNERLQQDRAGFIEAIQQAQRQTAAKPDNISYYIDSVMSDEIRAFKADVKTGYSNLDQQSGGLYAGLYIVAAISSLGKTTFVHQMGDQIAAAGTDVLYFSLEQSRLEMVTKSIARMTAQKNLKTAVTSLSIRKGYLPQNVLEAAKEYQQATGDRMSIIEGNFSCNISFIGDYIRRYIDKNGVKPVIIIDYLQILQPQETGGRQQTTKETVDSTVTELKRLSREQGLTIIAICSVNRANYLTPIDFESLKESGNIEFTADVIWGLQLHCLESDPVFDKVNATKEKREKVQAEKARNPRCIDLVCLKNRYGIASYSCSFEYYPANDLFNPVDDFAAADMANDTGRRI